MSRPSIAATRCPTSPDCRRHPGAHPRVQQKAGFVPERVPRFAHRPDEARAFFGTTTRCC